MIASPDGRSALTLCGQDTKLRLMRFDLTTGQVAENRLAGRMTSATDGHIALTHDDAGRRAGEVRLTDIDTGSVVAVLKYASPPGVQEDPDPHWTRFSADGRLVAILLRRMALALPRAVVKVWDTTGGPPLLAMPTTAMDFFTSSFSRDGRLFAFADPDGLKVWDLAAGREVWRKPDAVRSAVSLAFAPDGRTLAAGYDDTTILLWAMPPRDRGKPLDFAERAAAWEELSSSEVPVANTAMWRLTDDPASAAALLRDRLRPGPPAAAAAVRPLVKDLGSADFKVREAAERGLNALGRSATKELRAALPDDRRPEAKRRLAALLASLDADRVRESRAVAVLERLDTPEARRLLTELAAEANERTAAEAKAALTRTTGGPER